MSYQTGADKKVSQAQQAVGEAIVSLSEIVIDQIDGCEELSAKYLEGLKTVLYDLLNIREKLK